MVVGMKKLLEKWMGFITPKVLAGVFTAGYVLTLIPLLLIARYNFPSADDYLLEIHAGMRGEQRILSGKY